MKRRLLATPALVLAGCMFEAINSRAASVRYVDVNSTNATPPYTNWVTAATNIQDAVNAAAAGDEVLVTNGVYRGGLNVTNPLTLLSVNGPQFTVINGGHSNRCATLTSGASLTGFTLTNGHSEGHWLVVTQAIPRFFPGRGGGVYGGTLYNCTLTGNSADIGGGAEYCTLYHCTLSGNYVTDSYSGGLGGQHVHHGTGGGADSSMLHDCTLTGNWGDVGGGAIESTLYNCTLSNNVAISSGGGARGSTLYNCTLSGNRARSGGWTVGGGTEGGTLYNCTITGNSAVHAGGTSGGTLYNCTITGNSADYAGGTSGGTLYNCIVCSNTATNGANYFTNSALNYCCTAPMPTNGVGNITNEPAFVNAAAGDFHLQANSPCINAGNNAYVTTATDLDGNPRISGGTVDMGAYEFQSSISGGQFCAAACSRLTGFSFTFSGAIVGQPYRIQTSTTLAAGSWTDLTNFTYTGPIVVTDPSAVAGPKKFYRAVTP